MLDNSNVAPGKNKTLRCAIYTRKSHEEGLEQEFNSLDAQRESAEHYIQLRGCGAGRLCRIAMTMVVSRAGTWSVRGCAACWQTSTPGRSM